MVIFVDASVSAPEPYDFHELQAERDESYTTHAMSPAAVLDDVKSVIVIRQRRSCSRSGDMILSLVRTSVIRRG